MPGTIGLHGVKVDGIILHASLCHCCSRLGSCGCRHNTYSYQFWLRGGWTYRWLAAHSKSWQFLSVLFLSPPLEARYTNRCQIMYHLVRPFHCNIIHPIPALDKQLFNHCIRRGNLFQWILHRRGLELHAGTHSTSKSPRDSLHSHSPPCHLPWVCGQLWFRYWRRHLHSLAAV